MPRNRVGVERWEALGEEPLSIQLYAGNTTDPPTFLDAVEQLKVRFGTGEIVVVGDRGMIKAPRQGLPAG